MAAGLPRSATAGELDALYRAEGADADGRTYAGEVRIQSLGKAQAVLWRLESGEAYKGLGLVADGVLGVAYGPPEAKFGIVVYRIQDGILDGIWAMPDSAKAAIGREILEGSPDLAGDYRITLGENPDGQTNYTGKVHIQRQGEVYLMAWLTPGGKISALGLGVRQGDVMAVAYGASLKGIGSVAYKIEGSHLEGVWSSGRKTLGRETLTRQ